MAPTPLPTYEQLERIAPDEETLDRFLRGLTENPPYPGSPWQIFKRWRARKTIYRLTPRERGTH